MDAREFEELTGDPPVEDDLERANCPGQGPGLIGHADCGVCIHGWPRFMVCPVVGCKRDLAAS